jgi:hypothetical protein
MTVGICATALKLAWREFKEAHEMIDDTLELIVSYKASQTGTDLEIMDSTKVLERCEGN